MLKRFLELVRHNNLLQKRFDKDIYDAISLETCVNKRLTTGGPSPDKIREVIAINDDFLAHFAIV